MMMKNKESIGIGIVISTDDQSKLFGSNLILPLIFLNSPFTSTDDCFAKNIILLLAIFIECVVDVFIGV